MKTTRRLMVLGVAALSAGLVFGAVTQDKAVSIALSDAGLAREDAHRVHVHRDYDDGREEFEVDIHTAGAEWEYTIDAETGHIVGYDYEERKGPPAPPASIDRKAMEEIALSDAGFKRPDVSGFRSELDRDDGMEILEVKFNKDNRKYEYDVASTGEILKAEWELRREPWGRSDARLTEEEAERIALEAIGGDTDRFVVWEDRDDGRFVYECEAARGEWRYEIDIDGTGEVLSVKRSLSRW